MFTPPVMWFSVVMLLCIPQQKMQKCSFFYIVIKLLVPHQRAIWPLGNLIYILLCNALQGSYGSLWNGQSTYVVSEKQSSNTFKDQPTQNYLTAEKEVVANDDMEITECLLLHNMEYDKSVADKVHVGKETNNCSFRTSNHCKTFKSEGLQLYATEEVNLFHRKGTEIKYHNDSSDISESGEEWKPIKRARKKYSQNKAHSAKLNCKSLSKNMRNPKSRAVAEESTINRYTNINIEQNV